VLPPLDYDDTGRGKRPSLDGRRPKSLETTQPGRRRRSNRVLWFVLGIAFGAVAAVFARGDAMGTLQAARAWGASTLRSLEHKTPPASPGAPYSVTTAMGTAAPSSVAAAMESTPCPVDPGPGDPCAELLAPFATAIPTVNVDDLPVVTAEPATTTTVAPVVVVARRHARPAARPAPRPPAAPVAEESAETSPAAPGINPDEDGEPQGKPTRVVPAAAPPADVPVVEPAPELKSAKNDAT
jgi:hypothetical protein